MTLYFFYNTSVLRPESDRTYRWLAETLQSVPTLHVQLTGHTSLEGTERYNLDLSRRRAEAMRDALVREGVDPGRIQVLWFGASTPAVPEPAFYALRPSLERIRTMNRRVEVVFFDPTGQYAPVTPPLSQRPLELGAARGRPRFEHDFSNVR